MALQPIKTVNKKSSVSPTPNIDPENFILCYVIIKFERLE